MVFLMLEGHPDDAIRDQIATLGLDAGDAGFLGRLRHETTPPHGFVVRGRVHQLSKSFILKMGLDGVFDGAKSVEQATAVLAHRRARELTETLLIAGAPAKAIAGAVSRIIANMTTEAIEQFARLYFDLSQLTRGDVRVVLDMRADIEAAAALREGAAAAAAVRRRHRFDPQRIAVDLPQGATFAHVALLAAGIDVPASEPAVLLRRIRDRAVLRAAERVNGNTRRDANTTLTLVELALRATELMERVQDPQQSLVTALQRVTLRSSDGKLPTIHDLAGSNEFTVDLAPNDAAVQ